MPRDLRRRESEIIISRLFFKDDAFVHNVGTRALQDETVGAVGRSDTLWIVSWNGEHSWPVFIEATGEIITRGTRGTDDGQSLSMTGDHQP